VRRNPESRKGFIIQEPSQNGVADFGVEASLRGVFFEVGQFDFRGGGLFGEFSDRLAMASDRDALAWAEFFLKFGKTVQKFAGSHFFAHV
jgi:hypothetical protein